MLRQAGFKDVRVVGEAPFPLGDMEHDPFVKSILEEAHLALDELLEAGHSVVSLKVVAVK
jgi:hypothetical protein